VGKRVGGKVERTFNPVSQPRDKGRNGEEFQKREKKRVSSMLGKKSQIGNRRPPWGKNLTWQSSHRKGEGEQWGDKEGVKTRGKKEVATSSITDTRIKLTRPKPDAGRNKLGGCPGIQQNSGQKGCTRRPEPREKNM